MGIHEDVNVQHPLSLARVQQRNKLIGRVGGNGLTNLPDDLCMSVFEIKQEEVNLFVNNKFAGNMAVLGCLDELTHSS